MSDAPLHIAIAGIGGRMGREILQVASGDAAVDIAAGIVRPGGAAPGGVPLVTSVADLPTGIDVIIDFSVPAATLEIARGAAARSIPLVVGTTGLAEDDLAALK
jgi:4-hydroxy-tetrahydrodipicolinate reductase